MSEVPPYFVIWHGDEAPEPKAIKIHLMNPSRLNLVGIKPREPNVAARLEADKARRAITPP